MTMVQRTPVYHVVCHDCTIELLTESASEARQETQIHAASADHNVEFAHVGTRREPLTADD